MRKFPSMSCHVVLDSEVGESSAGDFGDHSLQLSKCTDDDAYT